MSNDNMIHLGGDGGNNQPGQANPPDTSIDDEMSGDLHGPGQTTSGTKPATVNIRGSVKHGKGLSKNGKKALAVGGVAIPALILTGIMMAGHHGTSASSSGNVELAGAGNAPTPPAHHLASATSLLTGSTGSSTHSNIVTTGGAAGQELSQAQVAGGKQKPLTPRQKYVKWLITQHYKDLEGQYLAAQSSLVATGNWTKANSNGGSLLDVSGQTSGNPSAAMAKLAALAAQAGSTSPAGIADLEKMQKLALERSAGGPGGAAGHGQAAANQGFMSAHGGKDSGYLDAQLHKPKSRSELFAGSVIPAVLVTGINSQLPGEITAQVRQTVYNSLNPNEVVIPQGSKLIGVYDSDVQYGQSRVLVAWSRVIYPDGRTIDLQGMSGVNGMGEAGFSQITDNHYFRIFGSAFLISMLGAGAQLAQPQSSSAFTTPSASQTGTAAMSQEMDTVATNMLNKNLDVAPTLKIRPGYLFNVMVSKTMLLPPYHP
ncbi:TrbI/VirB10 family protein [Acidithiobacillus sp. MC6.1]|nr:TrbI/VirB10 family protein [Acidithiobacillus sp. MC6.1]